MTAPGAAAEQPPEPYRPPGTGPGTGRPPLLTPELAKRIVDVVKVGNYLNTAAAYCGVGYSTLLLWQQKGRAQQERVLAGDTVEPGQQVYLDFLEAVTQAKAQAQVTALAHWRKAMAEDWRAAKEYLARTNPEQFGTTVQVQDSDSSARIDAAVEAATASLLHIGDGQGAYDPDDLGVDPDGE